MKVIAMYLPQFHRVKENDAWWGDGFTEWTAVKKARRLYDGHEQPRVPSGRIYYDLLDRETFCWQSKLMHEFNIDGMCFYHYYFKDGRKILEKPAENLLAWQDVDMPFCFSWANESWVRSWSKLAAGEGNPWSPRFDESAEKSMDDGVLLLQDYGGEKEWVDHYKYLSSFFQDRRYIKHEGMPVFVIYKPANVPCLKQMLEIWEKLARDDGFDGIYSIGTNIQEAEPYGLKGIQLQEPQDTILRFYPEKYNNEYGLMRSLDYQEVWDKIAKKHVDKNISLGGFVGYDDTPRHGNGGTVVRNRSPFVFYEGIKKILIKARRINSPFIFINAWNEWGEGMYLEPDEKFGKRFLEALKQARLDAIRISKENNETRNDIKNKLASISEENMSLKRLINRYYDYWRIFNIWMEKLEADESPAKYLVKMGYYNIAIYGYGMFGKHLVCQLNKENIRIKYIIDRQKDKKTKDIKLYTLDDQFPEVDCVVVTVLYDYERIEQALKTKLTCDVISIDMLFNGNGSMSV